MATKDHIANLIRTLDKEIEGAESLSPNDLELLQDLRSDIEKILQRSPKQASSESHAVIDRLRDVTERLEVTHPNLTGAMAQIIDSLVKLGF